MKLFKDNEKKQIFLSGLLIVIVIALYIEINALISKANINQIDITQDKVYTISNTSKDKISQLKKNVKITLVNFNKYENYVYADDAEYIVNQFDECSNKITVDHYEDNYNDTTNAEYPYIIFSCENNSRIVSLEEMYQYRYSTLYENQEEMYLIEPMILSSILRVSSDTHNNIYICMDKTAYTEKMFTSFVNIAAVFGADTYGLNLSEDKKIPEDCKVLVIPPLVQADESGAVVANDFSEEEKNVIIEYINNGGNILFLQESKSLVKGDTPNLDYIINLYGVSVSDGIVCQENNNIQDIPSYIHPQINDKCTIFKSINSKSMISVFDAGALLINEDNQSDTSHQVIIKCGEDAFIRKDLSNSNISKSNGDIEAKDVAIGVLAEKKMGENTSKAIIYSSSVFMTNNPVALTDSITNKKLAVETIILDNNSELTADTISTLIDSDEIEFKNKSKYNMVPSINILLDGITLKIIFIIPMIILIIGYFVWRYRKNKK